VAAADRAGGRRAAAAYREVRELVQLGDLWRLVSPFAGDGARAALAYTAADRTSAVVFAYQLAEGAAGAVPLAGLELDPASTYSVAALDLTTDELPVASTTTGAELLEDGLAWDGAAPETAAIWRLTCVGSPG
jgi:alpha-galactosidase